VDWSKKLTDQLNLAHVAREKYDKKKLKQTKRIAHLGLTIYVAYHGR